MDKQHLLFDEIDRTPNAFYVLNSTESHRFPMHSHCKHQIYYIDGGLAFFNTPAKSFFLPAHHFLWIPAGVDHNITSSNSVRLVHNIFFPESFFADFRPLTSKAGIYPVSNLLMEMLYYIKDWSGEFVRKTHRNQYEFLVAIKNVITDMADAPLPVELPTTTNEDLRKILKYIQKNLDHPLQLDQIAQIFGYSSRTLSRMFSKNINTSFLQYVKLSRVIRAMELLLRTNLSIGEITFKCGYSNLSSFSYVFQQIMHCSPVEFRKKSGV